jgi:hypothetical protein
MYLFYIYKLRNTYKLKNECKENIVEKEVKTFKQSTELSTG